MEEKDSCTLCGNRAYEKGKVCEICGARPHAFLGVGGGYLYPSEGRLFRRLVGGIALILILGIIVGSALAFWLMNPPL